MILVTGGTGLVGTHLLLKLVTAEEKVRAIHRQNNIQTVLETFSYYHSKAEAEKIFQKIEWVKADILNIPALTEAFKGITKVYHCAALISFGTADEKKMRKINIEGTANVVNLCIASEVKKLCYVSSIATLNQQLGSTEINEQSNWNSEKNHSAYAVSKYGAEMEVWRGTQEGVPAVIVNPGIIIGPGSWESGSGLLFSKVKKGLKFHFPKVSGFVGVHDVAKAMKQLMESTISNEQFVLVAENRSFKSILEIIAESLEKPAPKQKLKPWMIYAGWVLQSIGSWFGKNKQLNFNSAKDLYTDSYYSSQKIKERISFEFHPINKVISETAVFLK